MASATTTTTHVISISDGGEENINVAPTKKKNSAFGFIISRVRGNRIRCSSLVPNSNSDKKKRDESTRKMIHSIKVGISLVLVSLLYLLNPLFEQVGENAMWAIMTVVVIFEFSAGATLGKGFNRGIGTILGGGLGSLVAISAQNIGGVANSIIIGTCVFISGSVATYVRQIPRIKQRYDYGVMIFMLTFNLVVVSGVRADEEEWEIARERLLTIVMGFIVCICVSLFVFPLWASDELHDSTVSRFLQLANTIQGCLEEDAKLVGEKEKEARANFSVCKSVLNSKSKDELLANFAKWEPWHGKFGFSYPWEKYLKIGEVLRELAAFIVAVGRSLQALKQAMASLRELGQLEAGEEIGSKVSWALRELGDSMKQMRKLDEADEGIISTKLKAARAELSLVISMSKMSALENGEVLAIASFVLLLTEVLDKVEDLVKQVDELGDIAGFRTLSTPSDSS